MVAAMNTMIRYFILLLLALPCAVFGHQLDEYIQATLVAIEPGDIRLQIDLTPGVEIADQVLPLIDRDHNGVISTNEATAYAELLKRDLIVKMDEHLIALKLNTSKFPALSELRTGWGIIQLEFSVTAKSFASGAHKLTLENRHLPDISAYLVNAAKPKSAQIQITAQKRNESQSLVEVDFDFNAPTPPRQKH
jgi:hypothetical protein